MAVAFLLLTNGVRRDNISMDFLSFLFPFWLSDREWLPKLCRVVFYMLEIMGDI